VRLSRLLASLAVAAVVAVACGSHSDSAPTSTTGRVVPTQLQFTAKTLDGRDFNGQSLLGEPAVLWFWAPWCPVCQREAPAIGQTAAAHPTVTFVGVAGLDKVPAMQQFVGKYRLNGFTQLADTDGAVWAKFGVTHQPAYAFIRPDGGINVVTQALSDPDLSQRVTALVNP
jgi:thiol-disulfide isomerase/thioredoxin